MRIPSTPPLFKESIDDVVKKSPDKIHRILDSGIRPEPKGNYYHWDKLRHLKSPPGDLTNEEWWLGIKWARKSLYQTIPHKAIDGGSFVFGETNTVRRLLHEIDIHGGGS